MFIYSDLTSSDSNPRGGDRGAILTRASGGKIECSHVYHLIKKNITRSPNADLSSQGTTFTYVRCLKLSVRCVPQGDWQRRNPEGGFTKENDVLRRRYKLNTSTPCLTSRTAAIRPTNAASLSIGASVSLLGKRSRCRIGGCGSRKMRLAIRKRARPVPLINGSKRRHWHRSLLGNEPISTTIRD